MYIMQSFSWSWLHFESHPFYLFLEKLLLERVHSIFIGCIYKWGISLSIYTARFLHCIITWSSTFKIKMHFLS